MDPTGHKHTPDPDGRPAVDEDSRMSPGQRSLSDALALSLRVLRWILVVVVFLFLASGFFQVEEGEVAVVLRWGRIRGEPGHQLFGPGPHLAWPYPIEQPLRFPVQRLHSVTVESFWRYQPTKSKKEVEAETAHEHEAAKPVSGEGLNPQLDGYCICADRGLIYTTWTVRYRVSNVLEFLGNTGDPPSETTVGGQVVAGRFEAAERLVTVCLRNAVIKTAARYTVEEIYSSQAVEGAKIRTAEDFRADVERLVNAGLRGLKSGLEVTANGVLLERKEPPTRVRAAYEALTKAKQNYLRTVRDATNEGDKIRSGAESARAAIVTEAELYKAQVVQEAISDAGIFELLLKEYKGRPDALEVFLRKRLLEIVGQFLADADEKIIYHHTPGRPDDEIRIRINRDPNLPWQTLGPKNAKEKEKK